MDFGTGQKAKTHRRLPMLLERAIWHVTLYNVFFNLLRLNSGARGLALVYLCWRKETWGTLMRVGPGGCCDSILGLKGKRGGACLYDN